MLWRGLPRPVRRTAQSRQCQTSNKGMEHTSAMPLFCCHRAGRQLHARISPQTDTRSAGHYCAIGIFIIDDCWSIICIIMSIMRTSPGIMDFIGMPSPGFMSFIMPILDISP